MVSSWRQEGRAEGLQKGKANLLLGQMERRFGSLSAELQTRLRGLSAPQLDELGFALFDLRTLTEAEDWLGKQNRTT